MGRVEGKVAVVTGGASGLGAASAVLLAMEGAKVVVTDLNDAGGQAVAGQIAAAGGDAFFLHHDVTGEAAWEAVYKAAVDRFGRVDVVMNSAGLGIGGAPEEETLESWHKLMAVNLDAIMLGTKHAIRTMKEHKPATQGSIINLSSIEGIVGDPNLGAYNASKGAVHLVVKSLAIEFAERGIRVNAVAPGYVMTDMNREGVPEEWLAEWERRTPIGRLGEPREIASLVAFLASDAASYMTGSIVTIDGGYTAW